MFLNIWPCDTERFLTVNTYKWSFPIGKVEAWEMMTETQLDLELESNTGQRGILVTLMQWAEGGWLHGEMYSSNFHSCWQSRADLGQSGPAIWAAFSLQGLAGDLGWNKPVQCVYKLTWLILFRYTGEFSTKTVNPVPLYINMNCF